LEWLRASEWRLVGMLIDGVAALTNQTNIGQELGSVERATPEQPLLADDDQGRLELAQQSAWPTGAPPDCP